MRRGLLAFLLAALPFVAIAHETWLLPQTMTGTAGQLSMTCLTSGMAFPVPDTAPKPERVASVQVVIGGEQQVAAIHAIGDTRCPGALAVGFTPNVDGLAVAAVSLLPRDIDLEAAEVEEYVAEADPSAAVLEGWKRDGVWRETYVKNAKALICVGACKGSRTAMTAVGAGLEFVALEPGPHPRRFRLLAGGEPLAGQTVRVIRAGIEIRLRTDAAGDLTLPAGPKGPVLLSTIWLRPPAEPGGRILSDFASLVFEGR